MSELKKALARIAELERENAANAMLREELQAKDAVICDLAAKINALSTAKTQECGSATSTWEN